MCVWQFVETAVELRNPKVFELCVFVGIVMGWVPSITHSWHGLWIARHFKQAWI